MSYPRWPKDAFLFPVRMSINPVFFSEVVDDDSDDENEKKHYDNGYRWKWEGAAELIQID